MDRIRSRSRTLRDKRRNRAIYPWPVAYRSLERPDHAHVDCRGPGRLWGSGSRVAEGPVAARLFYALHHQVMSAPASPQPVARKHSDRHTSASRQRLDPQRHLVRDCLKLLAGKNSDLKRRQERLWHPHLCRSLFNRRRRCLRGSYR
jgi:hypothetical protein